MQFDREPKEKAGPAGARKAPGRRRWVLFILIFLPALGGFMAGAFLTGNGVKEGGERTAWSETASGKGATDGAGREDHGVAGKRNGEGRKILYYVDPMNPNLKSDKPGKAPDGMDLVPVYEEVGGEPSEAAPPGAIKISPQRQQLIGVQVGTVTEQPVAKTIRTVGRVTYDETKLTHVHTKFSGWIDKVYVDFIGKLVDRNQPLVSVYSPDLVSTQQELLIARRSMDILKDNPFPEVSRQALSLYDSTKQRLRLWDITDAQIREIERRGEPMRALTLHASITGYVLTRKVFEGQQVVPDTELYTIADLSSVWVFADVYEYEVPLIQLGQRATMTLSYYPGKVFHGKVNYISPELEPTTRTLKVRIEFPNPGLQLKPDMYANVELKVDYGRQLVLPQNAVLDSGSSQTVFIAREGGYFEPRRVTVGQRVNDLVILLEGVKAGERVVTSANFLLDSESQLKAALGGMGGGHAGHGGGIAPGGAEKAKPDDRAGSMTEPPADHAQHGAAGSAGK